MAQKNESISILKRVQTFRENSFSQIVSARNPFGLATNFSTWKKNNVTQNNILLYKFGNNAFISIDRIE